MGLRQVLYKLVCASNRIIHTAKENSSECQGLVCNRMLGSYPKLTVPVPVIVAKTPGGFGPLLLVLHWPFFDPLV
jgi:hypothetical protein